jgi:hypothetical protein
VLKALKIFEIIKALAVLFFNKPFFLIAFPIFCFLAFIICIIFLDVRRCYIINLWFYLYNIMLFDFIYFMLCYLIFSTL